MANNVSKTRRRFLAYLILRNERRSALGVYDATTNRIRRVDKAH